MLNRERGEDPSRAGRAVRTIAVMIKDMRIQRQLHSTQAAFVQTWMKHVGDTSTERHSIAQALCPPTAALCCLGLELAVSSQLKSLPSSSQGLSVPMHTGMPRGANSQEGLSFSPRCS